MLKLYRWGGVLILLIAGGLLVAWLGPTISEYVPKGLRRWAMLGSVLCCLLPYFIWQACFPPPFDITAFREHVDYEFKDKAYAREFLQLNPPGVEPDAL